VDEWVGERLVARPPRQADRDAYLTLFREREIERWLRPAPLPPFAEPDLVGMLGDDIEHWERHGFGPWVLTEPDDGAMLGRGGLRWTTIEDRLSVELPWTIVPSRQSMGLATEAALLAVRWARSLRLAEVFALVMPENAASRRVAQKVGFDLIGETEHAGLPHLLYHRETGARR
jgi:RimJ/RimL family protein N-acetyltransferase